MHVARDDRLTGYDFDAGHPLAPTRVELSAASRSSARSPPTAPRWESANWRVLDLGFSMLGSLELREIAAPHLRRLTDTTGHTSNLAIPVRSRSGEVVAPVNVSIPWSPVPITELVSQFGPTLQTTAHQIAVGVI